MGRVLTATVVIEERASSNGSVEFASGIEEQRHSANCRIGIRGIEGERSSANTSVITGRTD
jgi:hypothetical protein